MLTEFEINKVISIKNKLMGIDAILNEFEQATEYKVKISFLQSNSIRGYCDELFHERQQLKLDIMLLVKNHLDNERAELNANLHEYIENV